MGKTFLIVCLLFLFLFFSNYATMCDWNRENKREHGILSKQRNERKRRQNKRTPGLVFIAITTVSESDGQTDGQQTAGRTPENMFSISLRVDSRGDFFSRSSRFNPPLFFLYSCFKLSENIKIIPFSPWTTLLLPAACLHPDVLLVFLLVMNQFSIYYTPVGRLINTFDLNSTTAAAASLGWSSDLIPNLRCSSLPPPWLLSLPSKS